MNNYVTLQADLKYGSNTLSNFVHILDILVLKGTHEIGLSEFFFPLDYQAIYGFVELEIPGYLIENDKMFESFEQEDLLFNELNRDLEERFRHTIDKIGIQKESASFLDQLIKIIDEITVHSLKYLSNETDHLVNLVANEIIKKSDFYFDNIQDADNNIVYSILNFIVTKVSNLQDKLRLPKKKIKITLSVSDKVNPIEFAQEIHKKYSTYFYVEHNNIRCKPYITFLKLDSQYVEIKENAFLLKKNFVSIIKHFCVYTDIITDICKGEPVLKILSPEGKKGDYNEKQFIKPHYFVCNRTFINRMRIQIKDNSDQFIIFNSVPVILKIHFRKLR